jgi:SnoaL-like domain
MKPSLQTVADELAIHNVLGRYCRAIDRLDLAMLKSVYHPEGIDDHGVFAGNAHEFADFIIKRIRQNTDYGFHTVSHSTIDVRGNFAMAETYYSGYHLIRGADKVREFMGPGYAEARVRDGTLDQGHEYTCGGRYIDLFEKRNGEWRILHRRITNEWGRTAPTMIDWSEGELKHFNLPGARDKSDPYYALLEKFASVTAPRKRVKKAAVKLKRRVPARRAVKRASASRPVSSAAKKAKPRITRKRSTRK